MENNEKKYITLQFCYILFKIRYKKTKLRNFNSKSENKSILFDCYLKTIFDFTFEIIKYSFKTHFTFFYLPLI